MKTLVLSNCLMINLKCKSLSRIMKYVWDNEKSKHLASSCLDILELKMNFKNSVHDTPQQKCSIYLYRIIKDQNSFWFNMVILLQNLENILNKNYFFFRFYKLNITGNFILTRLNWEVRSREIRGNMRVASILIFIPRSPFETWDFKAQGCQLLTIFLYLFS